MTWLANLLIIVGIWQLGNKRRHAFLFSIAGELIWTATAFMAHNYDLASICAVFCVLAFRNWWKWGADSKGD